MKRKMRRLWRLFLWHVVFKLHYETAIAKLSILLCYPVLISFEFTWKEKFLTMSAKEFSKWAMDDVDRIADNLDKQMRHLVNPTHKTNREMLLAEGWEGISLETIRLRREAKRHEHIADDYNWKEFEKRQNAADYYDTP